MSSWAPGYGTPVPLTQGRRARIVRATRSASGADVVLKVLPPNRGRAELERLRDLSGVPGVVPLLDAGSTADGGMFVALPFYPDGSFAELLANKGPAPVQEAAAVARSVAGALEAMHQRGMLHGDVCPGNVLRAGRTPVLTGFGAVHRAGESAPPPDPRSESFQHAAPEALRGEPRTAASDVYQLASTVWTLLVGRPPFAEGDFEPRSYAERALTREVRPVPRSDVSRKLRGVLTRAMAKEPGERYTSAAAFANAFEQARITRPAADSGDANAHTPPSGVRPPTAAWTPDAPSGTQTPAAAWTPDSTTGARQPATAWTPDAPSGTQTPAAAWTPDAPSGAHPPATAWTRETPSGARPAPQPHHPEQPPGAPGTAPVPPGAHTPAADRAPEAPPAAPGAPGAGRPPMPPAQPAPGTAPSGAHPAHTFPSGAHPPATAWTPDAPSGTQNPAAAWTPDTATGAQQPATAWTPDAPSGAHPPATAWTPETPPGARPAPQPHHPEQPPGAPGTTPAPSGGAPFVADPPVTGRTPATPPAAPGAPGAGRSPMPPAQPAPGTAPSGAHPAHTLPSGAQQPATAWPPRARPAPAQPAAPAAPGAAPFGYPPPGPPAHGGPPHGPVPVPPPGDRAPVVDAGGTAEIMMAKLRGEEISALRAWSRLEGWSGDGRSSFLPIDEIEQEKETADSRSPAVPGGAPARWRRHLHIAVSVCGILLVTAVSGVFASTSPPPVAETAAAVEPSPEPSPSGPADEVVSPEAPPEVAAPSAVALQDNLGNVMLSWTDNSGGTASFFVLGGPLGHDPATLARTGPGVVSAQVITENTVMEYCFTVIAVDGSSAPAAEVCTARGAARDAAREAEEEAEREAEEEAAEEEEAEADPSPSPAPRD
ncbi:protein kinase [Nocardiopsis flavescens]|uniref:protein kinase domain-containing protein n=1 Tax=Nocardiopsis flavescens TaxID=758803 RepID=UPI0036DABA5E